MRYILSDTGFIEAVSFNNAMTCNNKSCTEYTGTVPTGYESLAIWSETANINAYKIVNGNLTYDSEEDARLQSLWASQQTGGLNDAEILNANSTSTTDTYSCNYINKFDGVVLYENSSGSNGTITLNETVSNYNSIEIFYADNNSKDFNSVKVYSPNGKTCSLSTIEPATSLKTLFRRTRYTISSVTIIPDTANAGYTQITDTTVKSVGETNYIRIIRVVGYK